MSADDGNLQGWKKEILEDFSRWLHELPEDPPPPDPSRSRMRALSDLFTLVMVLARDVSRHNRASSESAARIKSANETMAGIGETLRRQTRAIGDLVRMRSSDSQAFAVATSFLGIRDALVRTLELAAGREAGAAAQAPDLDGIASSLGLILRKYDAVLERQGITAIETIGAEFDPKTMNAIGTCDDPGFPDGVIARQVRGGFLVEGRVLRGADVVVNVRQKAGPRSESRAAEGLASPRQQSG